MLNRKLSLAAILAAAVLGFCASSRHEVHAAPATEPSTEPALVVGPLSSITDFGAVADGTTLNTQAIQKTIDHVAATGGGTVVVPAGTFLSGALFLKPGVNLDLEKDGVIKGSTDIGNYPPGLTRIEGHFQVWRPALINADHIDNLKITGEGTLDGNGAPFWKAFRTAIAKDRKTTNLDVPRPRLMFVRDSNHVLISGIHLHDSGFWNLHLYRCNDVTVDGLDIAAGAGSPSTDGMDIDSSQNITVRGCTISVNDDCIALKGSKGPFAMDDKDSPPVENIHIVDCTLLAGGGITCGSEATIVRHVLVEHCKASGPRSRGISMLRLKLRPDTPQDYEDITYRDITLDGAGQIITVAPWTQYFDLQGQKPPTSAIRNVTMSDIHGTFGGFGSIRPNKGDTIEHLSFENIDVKMTSANPKPRFTGVTDLTFKNVIINGTPYTP